MKTLKEELRDFLEFYERETYDIPIDELDKEAFIDMYIKKSINYDEPSEPEADGCNKQTQEICQCEIKSYYEVGSVKICAVCKGVIVDKSSGCEG